MKLVQFWCPYCVDWLDQYGAEHDENGHLELDGRDPIAESRWRVSYDNGETWEDTWGENVE